MARSHTEMALRTLAHIAKEPKAPPAARVAAAAVLLDRGWGKAVQRIEGELNVNYAISDQPLNETEWVAAHVQPESETAH